MNYILLGVINIDTLKYKKFKNKILLALIILVGESELVIHRLEFLIKYFERNVDILNTEDQH
jgi:hypothetical protein